MSDAKRPKGSRGQRPAADTAKSPGDSKTPGGRGGPLDGGQQPVAAGDKVPDEQIDQPACSPSITQALPGTGIAVVGLGGSAGALDSFKTFFEAMPLDSGAAFVVIQHLAPGHESLLSELLAQHTRMTVVQARDGMPVEPNCVYVIPPSEYLGIHGGKLYLAAQVKQGGVRMPIDFFLRSLADDRQERAVCVLFSGAGSDGALGVRAVRGSGGLTIAQDPQTAQYGDMPRSAIATKLVDYILSPDQIPQAIMDYLHQPYIRGGELAAKMEADGKVGAFNDILATVRERTGCDFRCYKKSTILRRIERRMGLHRIADMARYGVLLRREAGEVTQLHKDLLINVTAFFRDGDVFEELRRKALAPLLDAKPVDEPLRVWVPGCSSGEEAYSIIMLLMEEMTATRNARLIQAFATDIDEEALEFARQGLYPASIAADVGAARLSRFFVAKEQGYQVSESLRGSVVFASQNLITDPPFSKMDLISCRNLLIYLDVETQTKLVPLFNFALNPGGYLFLGKSEGVSGQTDLFNPVSKKSRLFRRITPARPLVLDTPILPGRKLAFPASPLAAKPLSASYAEAIRQVLLGHFAASVVLVDRRGQILQFHGQTGNYLNMPMDEPNLNLLDTAKEGLSLRLRSALHTAIDESKAVVLDPVRVTSGQGAPFVRVTVMPLPTHGEAEVLLAVIFEEVPRPAAAAAEVAVPAGSESAVRQLEEELRATQQDLRFSVEELQAANEELRVSNEEVVSTNEELQSTNEELETSKEELQSVNEELTTVNAQLQEKVERLRVTGGNLANLLRSTQIATLFLDDKLRIKFFTPATERVLKLIQSDIGRPISDLSTNFIGYDLTRDARTVAQGGAATEQDAHHADGSCYHVRVLPYLGQDNRIEGAVVTFEDVTRLRRAQEQTRRMAAALADSNDAVILFDLTGSIQAWNRGAAAMYGWSEPEALGMNIRDMEPTRETAAIDALIGRLLAGETVASFETQRRAKDGRMLDVWLTATAVLDGSRKIVSIATTERDITKRNRTEQTLRLTVDELARSNKDLEQFAYVASHDLQEPLRMVTSFLRLLEERYKPQLDAQAEEYIGFAVDGATRMSNLITDLLTYSRVGRKETRMERLDANRPLATALANLANAITEAGATVTQDELPSVIGDEGQLTQLFQNLIANAVKFRSPDRPCQVHVSATQQDGRWVFAVRDNGIGIAPEFRDRVFLIFQRLHGMDKYPGTGIGLAICKKIVERHGGRIWVESKVAEGCTFCFTL